MNKEQNKDIRMTHKCRRHRCLPYKSMKMNFQILEKSLINVVRGERKRSKLEGNVPIS